MIPDKKILLVEDNPADVELTRLSLQNLAVPAELIAFSEGADLFQYLDNQTSRSDISLIMLDLNMPRMSGIDILKRLHAGKMWSEIPVIIFSSSNQQADIRECYRLGANAYVTKPIDLAEFDKTIKAIANFWGVINRNVAAEAIPHS